MILGSFGCTPSTVGAPRFVVGFGARMACVHQHRKSNRLVSTSCDLPPVSDFNSDELQRITGRVAYLEGRRGDLFRRVRRGGHRDVEGEERRESGSRACCFEEGRRGLVLRKARPLAK